MNKEREMYHNMGKLAFIGGTGVYDPHILTDIRSERITTPYGEAAYEIGHYGSRDIIFLARHGFIIPFLPTRLITGPISML